MSYRIVLRNGFVHVGNDERYIDEIMEAIRDETPDEGVPPGWLWLAGLTVRRSEIVAVA